MPVTETLKCSEEKQYEAMNDRKKEYWTILQFPDRHLRKKEITQRKFNVGWILKFLTIDFQIKS